MFVIWCCLKPNFEACFTDGASPTPIGPPRATSPLPPSTPPMPDIMSGLDDRRQPVRPIGGERSQRKVTGSSIMGPATDFGDAALWSFNSGSNIYYVSKRHFKN